MTAAPVTVAAFDFDGTLTDRDTVVPFLRRVAGGGGAFAAALAIRGHRLAGPVLRRDRDRIRAIATAAVFAGRRVAEIEEMATVYAADVSDRRLRPGTVARLRWHREAGHRVVIVSASYEVYLTRATAALGVDAVLATRLVVNGDVYTGELDGPNCRGPEKVRRLDAWLAARSLDRDGIALYAYGDSAGDRELLAAADHPCRVAGALASVAPAV